MEARTMQYHFCRICRTDKNLKFTDQQLRKLHKWKNAQCKNSQKALLIDGPTLGNICYNCEDQRHRYHQLDDDDDSEVDVDDNGKMQMGVLPSNNTIVQQRKESPIIEDNSEMLYDMILQKSKQQRCSNDRSKATQEMERKRELTQHTLGSDGDTEVIEVLTSRENTPTPQSAQVPQLEQKIVAVIDLELDDEDEATGSSGKDVHSNIDDKNINMIYSDLPTKKSPKKLRRKLYEESELRLIASLSLVSSDSEAEELHQASTQSPASDAKAIAAAVQNNAQYKCQSCDVCMSDQKSLEIHQQCHVYAICPVCQLGFQNNQRLVHHMRFKHRSYEGDTLRERPRCAQDSAMTIRLRYMQRFPYYECQLCGRIDAVFKEHKQHVLENHAVESKCLNDPMMKELLCPICKEPCGMQHLKLCKHLLSAHTPTEYKTHLKEIKSLRTSGWSSSRQKDLEQTAHIYQLPKRKNYYFKCKQCNKVVGNYLNHMHHQSAHRRAEKQAVKPLKIAAVTPKTSTSAASATSPSPRHAYTPKRDKVKTKALRKCAQSPRRTRRAKNELRKLVKKTSVTGAVLKVKLKSPLRRFPTQKYSCQYCRVVLKGFYRWNLHMLALHTHVECTIFRKINQKSSPRLRPQQPKRPPRNKPLPTTKHSGEMSSNATGKRTRSHVLSSVASSEEQTSNNWLCDLLESYERRMHANKITADGDEDWNACGMTRARAQCCYCSRLFTTVIELNTHERQHLERREVQMIKRLPI